MPSKRVAQLKSMVEERGRKLRTLSFHDLIQLSGCPVEKFMLDSRPATIAVIVQTMPDGQLRVVVQGFLKAWLGEHVAVDGFYKHPDESITPMHHRDLHNFD
jgi:hypothetical protein